MASGEKQQRQDIFCFKFCNPLAQLQGEVNKRDAMTCFQQTFYLKNKQLKTKQTNKTDKAKQNNLQEVPLLLEFDKIFLIILSYSIQNM